MRKRIWIAGAALGVVAAGAAGGVAVAGNGGDDGPASHDYTQEQADAATKAALEATGGGTANSVETDNENGATYEVEVTKTDGTTVDVRLDDSYQVVVIEADSEDSGSE
ncbi:putative membrane protein YkoI [Nocardioides sp. BE266]|uniref:PepSY domain-containing protein n=1 Tax=Nocardioides sp. BE266 TaxID=2817725 RepID=UPI00285B02A7|nr:PepSY domain-containing protein [Nocardioides sp. BE266]MDR7254786.1 putative membrane protein YkoI [Nocardioides sp. BE266]